MLSDIYPLALSLCVTLCLPTPTHIKWFLTSPPWNAWHCVTHNQMSMRPLYISCHCMCVSVPVSVWISVCVCVVLVYCISISRSFVLPVCFECLLRHVRAYAGICCADGCLYVLWYCSLPVSHSCHVFGRCLDACVCVGLGRKCLCWHLRNLTWISPSVAWAPAAQHPATHRGLLVCQQAFSLLKSGSLRKLCGMGDQSDSHNGLLLYMPTLQQRLSYAHTAAPGQLRLYQKQCPYF